MRVVQKTATTDVERLYYSSISSPYTQRSYRTYLQKYLAFYGLNNISELLNKDHKEIEHQIINFIITAKEKGMKRGSILNYTCPVISFCKINDIMLNTTKINKYMPAQVRSKKTYGYDIAAIQKLLDISDERMRVVILLGAHGLRIGAISGLNVGSLEEYKDLYKITVYENTSDEYVVFSTSELKRAIRSYLSMRSDVYGEVISSLSPLVREQFDRRDQFAIAHPKRVKEPALAKKLSELAEAAGLRTKVQLKEGQQAASIRSSIPRTNGLRRFYCGVLAESGLLTAERRWLLEGHRLKGNDSAYLKITTEDLYQSFMLVHNSLLIDQSQKLQKKLEISQKRNQSLDALLDRLDKLEKEIGIKI